VLGGQLTYLKQGSAEDGPPLTSFSLERVFGGERRLGVYGCVKWVCLNIMEGCFLYSLSVICSFSKFKI